MKYVRWWRRRRRDDMKWQAWRLQSHRICDTSLPVSVTLLPSSLSLNREGSLWSPRSIIVMLALSLLFWLEGLSYVKGFWVCDNRLSLMQLTHSTYILHTPEVKDTQQDVTHKFPLLRNHENKIACMTSYSRMVLEWSRTGSQSLYAV